MRGSSAPGAVMVAAAAEAALAPERVLRVAIKGL